jgi:anti-sigma factor RsiW
MESSCKEIEQMLVDYADGQLSPGESGKVAEHLAKCGNCRSMLEALQRSLTLAGVIWDDALAEVEPVRTALSHKPRRIRWPKYAAIAASILLVVGSFLWRALTKPTEPELTLAQIECKISESASAARLLAAADLLAKYPGGKAIVNRQYRYIAERYSQTLAGSEAKSRIEN